MNRQDNLELNNQEPLIEDLTVNEDQAAAVKGGTFGEGKKVTIDFCKTDKGIL